MRRTFRLLPALSLALLSMAILSGSTLAGIPVPPEQKTGKVGPYVIADADMETLATCRYAMVADDAPLQQVTIDPPVVRWPNTKPSVPGQKGTVGWRVIIQAADPGWASWTTVAQRPMQKRTATEAKPAAFTARTIAVPATEPHTGIRVIVVAAWYKADGSLRGRVRHTMSHYVVTNLAALGWTTPVCSEVRDFPAP
jgi:hypothetical protein